MLGCTGLLINISIESSPLSLTLCIGSEVKKGYPISFGYITVTHTVFVSKTLEDTVYELDSFIDVV